MKIQTMSIVCGTTACNARCPFCVSKTTCDRDLPTTINRTNLDKALRLAARGGATTCLITGKGEPTLYPEQIGGYAHLANKHLPLVELQTNGIKLADGSIEDDMLVGWNMMGLNTICLSAVHIYPKYNRQIYGEDYPAISELAEKLIRMGFTVRLSLMLLKGYVDNMSMVNRVVQFCKDNGIKQLTMRPIDTPDNCGNETAEWVRQHTLKDNDWWFIVDDIERGGTPVLKLSHGATVFDYQGQNLCISNCLTTNETDDDIRQIIYFPDGTIAYDWEFQGAVIL